MAMRSYEVQSNGIALQLNESPRKGRESFRNATERHRREDHCKGLAMHRIAEEWRC